MSLEFSRATLIECCEVVGAGKLLVPLDRLFDLSDCRLCSAVGVLQELTVLTLDPFVFGVANVHTAISSMESRFTMGSVDAVIVGNAVAVLSGVGHARRHPLAQGKVKAGIKECGVLGKPSLLFLTVHRSGF
jgi:hypothetical protein